MLLCLPLLNLLQRCSARRHWVHPRRKQLQEVLQRVWPDEPCINERHEARRWAAWRGRPVCQHRLKWPAVEAALLRPAQSMLVRPLQGRLEVHSLLNLHKGCIVRLPVKPFQLLPPAPPLGPRPAPALRLLPAALLLLLLTVRCIILTAATAGEAEELGRL